MKKIFFCFLAMGTLAFMSCKKEAAQNSQETKTATTTQQRTHPAQKSNVKTKSAQKATHAQSSHLSTGGMEWLTFDDVAKLDNKEGKKYLVDVYTEWCGWCKVMDKKTFTDPAVQAYLDENFHIVKFDAERKSAIPFKGKTYEWQQGGRNGINKLAIELLGSRMSYPTMVYLDENLNKIRSIPGYKKPDQLLNDLKVITGS